MADGEGTTLGALYLELGLDADQYTIGLELAKQQAMAAGAEIERALLGRRSIQGSLNLSPKVDFSQLHELNRLYDVKGKHARSLQRQFDTRPLKPKVDTQQLDNLGTRTDRARRKLNEMSRNTAPIKLKTQADFSELDQMERRLSNVSSRPIRVGVSVGGGTGAAGNPAALADAIGKSVARHSKPGAISSILSAPLRALGFVGREFARGSFIDAGAGFARGIGLTGASRKTGQKTAEYAQKINDYLIGVEDVMAGFVAEITRSGDIAKATNVAASRARFNKHLQKLQKMQQIATLPDDIGQAANIPELLALVPEDKREAFKADPKAYLKKDRRTAVAISRRSQELIKELNPQGLIQELINPLLADFGGVTSFISKVQANRAIIEAQNRRTNATRPLLPNLQEGQEGYVNVIGGAMFRKGQGQRQLDAAFEAMFPDRRILGVSNPDTDPGGEPTSPLAKMLFDMFKQMAPDMAKNQEMSNTIANALTMLGASLDPMYRSEAVSQTVANILAAQEAGVDPSKVATVSYSLGGMEAEGVAKALEILDMKDSKVLALAYPGMNFSGKAPGNFRSTLIEEDPLGFAKNVLGLGSDQTHRSYQTGVPSSASAHAYQHYFKNPQQVADFYDFLGIKARPEVADTKSLGKFLGNASAYYESVGSMAQVQSLIQTGKFDPKLPVKSFQHSDNVTGSAVIAKFLESTYTMDLPLGNLSPEQQAIQTKFQQKLQETFRMLVDSMIAAGEDISADITPADLYGRIKYDEELRKYNANIQAFQTGQLNDDSWFAGDFDPIKVQQRFADLDKGEAFFSNPNIMPEGSAYRDKMLLLFKNLRTVMEEFVATGKVSEQTLAQIRTIEPEKFSDAFLSIARQTMDDTKSPGIESTRQFQRPAPDWAYENPASVVAHNKMIADVGQQGYVPPLDQIKAAAYGMSGASAFITEDFVYKNDIGDSSKIASDQEVRAYKRLAGRYAPLLYHADPGKALVTERIKGTPVKELLDQAAKPAKAARKRLEKLQADLAEVNAEIARADEDADTSDLKAKQAKLVDRIRKQSEAFQRTRFNFNNYAEGLYEQIGQLGATLQSMGVAHNDLASGNVFVTDEGVKAIDLGNAVVNPTGMQKFQDQATTIQRAVIDRDYYGILDPMMATRAITRGYGMGAMPLPEKRKGSVADLPQYENVEQMPLGSDADTFLEQFLNYQELLPEMRAKVAERLVRAAEELERQQQKAEAASAAALAEIEQTQRALIGDMDKRVRRRRAKSVPTIGPVTQQGLAGYSNMPADVGARLQAAAKGLPVVSSMESTTEAQPVNIPLNLPTKETAAIELAKSQGGLIQRTTSAVGGAIVGAVENVAGRIKDSIEDYAVTRLNSVLMRVPGQPNTLDPSRQIGGLDELDLSDLFKASLIGIEDVTRGTLQTLVQTYAVAKGVEGAVFKAVPLIGAIGAVGKNVVMPLAIGAGVTHLPGIGGAMAGAETLLADTMGNLLAGTGIGAVEMAGSAAGGWVIEATNMIANVQTGNFLLDGAIHAAGNLAGSATLGTGQAIGSAAEVGIQALSGAAAHVATPLLTGQALMGGADQAISSILTPEQIAANKQLKAATENQVKMLQSAVKSIKALASTNPEQARYMAGVFEQRHPELQGTIDQGLKALPPGSRMSGSAGELAALKGQLEIASRQIQESEDRAARLIDFLRTVSEKLQRAQSMQPDFIEAEVVSSEVEELPALPAATSASKKELQQNLDEAVAAMRDQIDRIGKTFSEQAKSIRPSEGLLPEIRAQIAAAIESATAEARAAIDESLAAFGDKAPKSVRDAAKSARQRITSAEKSAKSALEQAEESGAEIPQGYNQGIQSQLDALKQTAAQMANVVIAAAEAELEIKSPSRVFQRIGAFVVEGFRKGIEAGRSTLDKTKQVFSEFATSAEASARTKTAGVGLEREVQRTSEGVGAVGGLAAEAVNKATGLLPSILKAVKQLEDLKDQIAEQLAESVSGLPGGEALGELILNLSKASNLVKPLLLGFAAFKVVGPIFGAIGEAISSITAPAREAAKALESMQARFNFNFGTEGEDRLEEVSQRAVDLRQNIGQVRQAYLEFASATKGTALESSADLASQAINQAALVQGLDPERQQRAQIAITQIASKGRLSAEEVRGQLAEALPGSTAIFARSQGMTVREFSRALDQGQFSAEDALPKFLAQLQAETSSGVTDSVNTAAAATTNLNNQMQLLLETVGRGALPFEKLGLNAAAAGIQAVNQVIEPLIQLLGSLAVAAIGRFAAAAVSAQIATNGFAGSMMLLKTGVLGAVKNMGGALAGFFGQSANSLAGWTVGIFGAIEAFKIISANFKDAGGAARQFAKDSEKALKDYDRNAQNSRRSPFGIDFNAPSSLETGVVGSILGTEGARAVEQTGQNLLREGFRLQSGPNKGEVMNFVIPDWVPGLGGNNFAPGTTLAEKQAQDQEIAFADAAVQSGIVIDRIRGLTNSDRAQQITGLNTQIRDIQTRRNALSPDRANDQQRAALTEQERRLTNQRTGLEEPFRFLSGRNSAAIELFRKLRAEAPDELTYKEANAQLEMAIKAQERLNALMNLAAKSAAQMKLELEQVVGKLAEANQQNEIMAANSRASVAESQLAGISEGVAAYQQFINVQNEASAKIAANNEAISKTAQMLSDVNVQRVLAANQFTSESSPADIRAKAAQMPESEDRDLLEQAASQIETINNTRLDNANQNAQLKEAQAQYVNRIRDLAKSVLDFYRGIEQQAAETALATQQSIAQANTTAAQTRLRSTLIGFQESFTNDFVTALIDLVETLNKPLNDAIAAQQQILSAQAQYFGQLQQAVNLQQQLPSNVPIQGGATPLGGQPQAAGAQPGAMPVMGGAVAGAMPGAAGGMVAIPNTLAGQSPDQIMGSLRGFQSMDLNAAARFSGQGIQQGVSLAGANYQMTVGNIQRQLQQQQAMAAVEAEMGRSNARMSLFRANREMQQQGIGFDRSLQDLQLRGQVQTPEVEFQQQRLQLDREFQDQLRSFGDFQRGLSQTIQQQEALKGMIESGQLPGLEDFLPDIQATIDNARNEFNNLDRNLVEYRKAYEAALARQDEERQRAENTRRFDAAQRIRNSEVSGLRGQAQLARNQGRAGLGRSLDFRASALELDLNFRAQIKELEDLRYNNILTADEFENLKKAAEDANKVSMQNLIEETNRVEREARLAVQQRMAATDAGLMRARASLSGIRGDSVGSERLNIQAQIVETKANLGRELADLETFKRETGAATEQLKLMEEQIRETNSLQLEALEEQLRQVGQGATYALSTMRQMASFGRKLSNETPAFGTKTEYSTSDLLRAALSPSARGPGGLFSYVASGKFGEQGMLAAKLADLVQANPFNAISAQMQANKIAEGVDAGTLQVTPELISKIDELIQATKSSAGRPSLTVNSVENIGLAGQIYNDLSRDSFRSSGF